MDVRHVITGEVFSVISDFNNMGQWGYNVDADGCLKLLDEHGEVRYIKVNKLQQAGI